VSSNTRSILRKGCDTHNPSIRETPAVLEAGLWAALGQSALVVGALLVARFRVLTEPRWLGLVMAFGAGALISAVTTDLVVPAYHGGGRAATGVGLLVGAVGYYALTEWLNRRAEREDPEQPVEAADDVGPAELPAAADARAARNLTVGMVLDGIPESVAIGLTLLGTGDVSVALVGAVLLSNLPEAIGVAAALLAGDVSLGSVLLRFGAIVLVGGVAGAIGYGVLNESDVDLIAVIQSIAAGAMIVVVVNEMVPIAVRGARRYAGLAAAAGFAVAAFLATLGS
jgi:ZIP family zinc transporter